MRKALEFRFTLSNPDEGSIEIDEPVGWDTAKFLLQRDEKYHSILFEYSTQLKFYRSNKNKNGGAEFILFIENKYGTDGVVNLQVEISDHGREWEVVYTGKLNLEDLIESEKYVECISEQEDFWTIFNQRADLKVSFKDSNSVDGVLLQPYAPFTMNMHSKVLVKQTRAAILQEFQLPPYPTHEFTINARLPGPASNEFVTRTSYVQFDFSGPTSDELKDYWKVGGIALPEAPPEIYTAGEEGLHTFDIRLDFDVLVSSLHLSSLATSMAQCGAGDARLDDNFIKTRFIIRDAADNEKYSDEVDWGHFDACGSNSATHTGEIVTFSLVDFNLDVGDKVYLYSEVRMEANYERLLLDSKLQYLVGYLMREGSYLRISGKTFTEPSTAPAMRIHDVLQNLCNKLTNRNDSFYSESFGYIGAPYHSYSENGVHCDYALQNGFNIRNFPWEDRPLQLDWKNTIESLDAIFGISVSLEVIDGVQKIRVETLDYAYSKDPVLNLTFANGIKRTIAKDKFYNQIQIGYQEWQPEEINGLDEFATKHSYTTDLKTIGNTLVLLSSIIASGSLIEVTRRSQYDQNLTTDTKYDESIFIIATVHGDPTIPQTNEYFDTVNNLLSPETAYNLRLWPAYNLLRQGNRINGCLLNKLGSSYKFQSGEGNYIVQMEQKASEIVYPGSYNADLLEVGPGKGIQWAYADLPEVTPLWFPVVYDFTYPLSMRELKILKENRNKSITVSGDLLKEAVKCYVLEVEAGVDGLARWKMLASNILPFNYVPEDADHLILQDGFDLLMENGDLILI